MPTLVTYRAPPDDSPVVHMGGVRFFDGVATAVENPLLLEKLRRNRFFDVDEQPPAAESAKEAEGDERSAVLAELAAFGVIVDKRWGLGRLKDELDSFKLKEKGE